MIRRGGPSALLLLVFATVALPAQSVLRESAAALGVDHFAYDPAAMAGGVAILDFNNDGHQDIYLTGGLAPDLLYENRGDGTFIDVSRRRRITAFNQVKTMGVTAADYDGDGFVDLFVTTGPGVRNYLLRNEGGEFFTDVTAAAGLGNDVAWSTTAAFADYDADGDLDLYVANYVDFSAEPFEEHITAPQPDFLYRNDGAGRFTVATDPAVEDGAGCTLVAHFSDYDRDGDPDLFVLNDFGDFYVANRLLANGGGPLPTFQSVGRVSGANAAINCMGIATGDYNEDGYPDYYLTNIGDNILYRGDRNRSFENVATARYVNDGTGVSWGTIMQDLDNDGHLDLYVNKGSLGDGNDAQFNRLYLGSGPAESFDDISRTIAITDRPNRARGVAYGDLNNDGRLDLVVANLRVATSNTARTLIYLGTPAADERWLKFRLEGRHGNRAAVGAQLTLHTGGRQLWREHAAGGSYLSSHAAEVHFGLGTAPVDSLVVDWPAPGGRETYYDLDPRRTYTLIEGAGTFVTELVRATDCDPGATGVFRDLSDATPHGRLRLITVVPEPDSAACAPPVTAADESFPYPVPFTDWLRIPRTGEITGTVQLELFSATGRRVYSNERVVTAELPYLEITGLRSLPPGVYLLRTAGPLGETWTRVVRAR